MIAEAMATNMILKRYSDGTYVGNFWEKFRHGKGEHVCDHLFQNFIIFRLFTKEHSVMKAELFMMENGTWI